MAAPPRCSSLRTLGAMLWVKAFPHRVRRQLVRGPVLPAAHLRQPGDGAGRLDRRARAPAADGRKLLRFTTMLAVPALGLGLWLWLGYGIGRGRATAGCTPSWRGAAGHRLPPRLRRAAAQAGRRANRQPPLVPLVQRTPVLLLLAAVCWWSSSRSELKHKTRARRRPGPWRRPMRRWWCTPASIPSPAGATRDPALGLPVRRLAQVLDRLRRRGQRGGLRAARLPAGAELHALRQRALLRPPSEPRGRGR
jgi:putative membrane protein